MISSRFLLQILLMLLVAESAQMVRIVIDPPSSTDPTSPPEPVTIEQIDPQNIQTNSTLVPVPFVYPNNSIPCNEVPISFFDQNGFPLYTSANGKIIRGPFGKPVRDSKGNLVFGPPDMPPLISQLYNQVFSKTGVPIRDYQGKPIRDSFGRFVMRPRYCKNAPRPGGLYEFYTWYVIQKNENGQLQYYDPNGTFGPLPTTGKPSIVVGNSNPSDEIYPGEADS